MNNDTLFVGLEVDSGEEVEVPIFHTLTTGQTQLSGKTTVQKNFAEQLAEKDFQILIFDTKENLEDYSGIGRKIPVCLRESTDPLVLLPLLESIMERRLPTGYFAVLSEVTSGIDNYCQVIERARSMEESSRSGWKKGACRTLWELLERLEQQLAKVKTVSELKLPYKINRMVLNYFPRASQQLFIRNAFQDILKIHNKRTIPMLDEAYKFLPQKWGSACARAIQDVITQTAITETYCYLATQFLAPTNKDPLKACAVRLLGTQDHKTEAKHTLDLIPFKGIATEDDIMKLPLGHYYVTTKKSARLTYFLPKGVPYEVGRAVARGKMNVEFVRDTYLKPKKEEMNDLIYKEKAEKLEKELGKTKSELERVKRQLKELTTARSLDQEDKVKSLTEDLKKARIELKNRGQEIADLKTNRKSLEEEGKKLTAKLKLFKEFQDLIKRIAGTGEIPRPAKGKSIGLEHHKIAVSLEDKGLEEVKMATTNIEGKIIFCALKDLPKEGWKPADVKEKFAERGWSVKSSSLSAKLSLLCGDSLLIKVEGGRYRLPTLVKFDVTEADKK